MVATAMRTILESLDRIPDEDGRTLLFYPGMFALAHLIILGLEDDAGELSGNDD
jgi:hypothetical protein